MPLCLQKTETRIFQRWQETGSRKICLKVEDLIELNDYLKQAKMSGILTYVVADAGLTEIPKGTVTVLAIGPAPRKSMDMLEQFETLLNRIISVFIMGLRSFIHRLTAPKPNYNTPDGEIKLVLIVNHGLRMGKGK